MNEILKNNGECLFLQNRENQNPNLENPKFVSNIKEIVSVTGTECHEIAGNILDPFKKDPEVINGGKHRIENLNYRELTPELIKEFSDFYLEIFRNDPYSQFLLHEDDPLAAISPQEAFNQPDKKYFSLEELENFPVPDGMYYWMEREKTYLSFEEKLMNGSFITRLVDNQTNQTVGLVSGRQASLRDVFETEEMKNPLLFSDYFDPNLIADDESFFEKMKLHCDLDLNTNVFYVSCLAIHPSVRGGSFFKFLQNFMKSISDEVLELPFFAEIEHDGAGHDISVTFSDSEIFGVLKNGHPIAFCKKFRSFAEAFFNGNNMFIEKLVNYKNEQKEGKKHPNDNPNVELRETKKYGKGVFAKEAIKKGETIAVFEGEKYEADQELDLPEIMRDHCIQVGNRDYIFAHNLLAEKINHSCEPNCGLNDSVKVVAMRNIKPGEQITWDYRMSEDSNWEMACKCGAPTCSGRVGNFQKMPSSLKDKYFEEGYLSDWLIEKYDYYFHIAY